MKESRIIGLGGSCVARLGETADALRAELGLPPGSVISAFDHVEKAPDDPVIAGFSPPPDSPERFDQPGFLAALLERGAGSGQPIIAVLGPLAAAKVVRDACQSLIFIEVEERLSLLRWADRLMEAGMPGGIEALVFHESQIAPRYAAWSPEAIAAAGLVLDDEESPAALGSKIAWFIGHEAGKTGIAGAAAGESPRAPAPSEDLGKAAPEPRPPEDMIARLEAARALERRLGKAREPNRLGLAFREFLADKVYPAAKRGIDISLVSILLYFTWPIFAIVAFLIWLDDPGPVIYTQTRIGKHGKPFRFPKFRSMVLDADKLKDKLLAQNEMKGGITFKMKRDPRIIPIGFVMRKYSLDELPQLWSILRGDLTLVGPRPPVPREVALYTSSDRRRLEAVPGLTCIWQVSGRSDIPFPRQVELDVEYLEQRSLLLDLRILMATIPAVITGKGAY